MGQNRGLLRLYADRRSHRLLGASMVGPRCEHLAHLIAWSVENRMTVDRALEMPFYHPVIEEALQSILQGLLDHRMVEGHLQRPVDGHTVLDGPGDQVGQMLAPWADHRGAQQPMAAAVGVESQQAAVLAHDPRNDG